MTTITKAITIGLITLGLYSLSHFSGAIPFFDYRFFDLLSRSGSALDKQTQATVIVEIDENSLKQLGQWPWPRILLAKAIEEIQLQRPAAIGLDIFFPEPDRTSPRQILSFYNQMLGLKVGLSGLPEQLTDHDQVLAHALRAGPTVLPLYAFSEQQEQQGCALEGTFIKRPDDMGLPQIGQILCNTPTLQQSAQGFGYINASVDEDGIFRRQPLFMDHQGWAIPNLVIAMLRQVDPELSIQPTTGFLKAASVLFSNRKIPLPQNGEVLNRLYPESSFERISLADVLAHNMDDNLFSGKFVLIGATAAGLFDQFMTPRGEIIPGVYVHAALIENIMQNRVQYQPEATKTLALILSGFLSLIVVWLVFERHYLWSWFAYLTTAGLALITAWYQLEQGRYISVGYFLTPFSFLFFIISLFFAVLHYVERKRFLEDLGEAHSATIDSMTMVAESRDVETGSHITRTKEYIRIVAKYLRRNTKHKYYLTPHVLDLLFRAAPLHDIGKVGIPDVILQKTGPLDDHEIKVMRTHVDIGRTIIENAINSYNKTNEFLTIASNIAHSHHEKWDGSGYPLGLKGEEIPLEGRMMALADVYDALISRRCYKEPMPFELAEKIIIESSGKHFDPMIIAAFTELKQEFREIALKYAEGSELQSVQMDETYVQQQADMAGGQS